MKIRIGAILLFATLGISSVGHAESPPDGPKQPLQFPFQFMDTIPAGDYLTPIAGLLANESAYVGSSQEGTYWQALGTAYSYAGRLVDAQQAFDRIFSTEIPNDTPNDIPADLTGFVAADAVAAIAGAAKTRQVVMINEAHHVPETRGLTRALLKPLWHLGYRYLAAETFNRLHLPETVKRGMPLRTTGYYTAEPLFADVVREALRLGFTLVAYEHEDNGCDYAHDPAGCQDQRERGQAQNLVDRIFQQSPRARVIVHAGYGHIDKKGGSQSFPWIPMARHFRDLSGIDPLSIDQTTFRSHPSAAIEKPDYRRIVTRFAVKSPVILRSAATGAWFAPLKDHYDMQVILPPVDSEDGHSAWLMKYFGREKHTVSTSGCTKFPCLIEAALESELGGPAGPYVPFDQVLVDDASSAPALYLAPGKYRISHIMNDRTTSRDFATPLAAIRRKALLSD